MGRGWKRSLSFHLFHLINENIEEDERKNLCIYYFEQGANFSLIDEKEKKSSSIQPPKWRE